MNVALAAVAAFNLVCSGTQTTDSLSGKEAKEYEATYRINLDAGKWCEADCKALHDVASVQPTQILLQDSKVDTPSERSLLVNRIDRETGSHTITSNYSMPRLRGMIIIMKYQGMCERTEFTGFPKFETKF